MRDIDISSRDMFGHVTFGFKPNSQLSTGIEILIQKFTIFLMSGSKETYFNSIYGGDILDVGKFNFNSTGQDDFKVNLTSSIGSIVKKIQSDEIVQNVNFSDRLKSVTLEDIIFDQKTGSVYLSLAITSNSSQKTIKLPVK